ncbi:hypothetical protein [Flavobacterium silvaticum]|uniref:Uncharacterized protein n=1 Tax=Flavobacterium silvaticum TaxID=1852020 RepID=A0A972JGW1_9FLAO|nr:hypothetical protein [Flavobacterium silvaticum]NMH27300.1 hypothetical protein [Flavobacterium silvaticum]
MNPTLRNILAVIAGAFSGSIVNGALITISPYLFPPPEGYDFTNMEGLKAALDLGLMTPKYFIMPFLAHALGTFFGAWVAVKIGPKTMRPAYIVGFLFLLGGIANCFMIPAPAWFMAIDLLLAYIPMAYLGGKLAMGKPVEVV